MEQIVKLLFATTVVSIFAYVLIFTSVGNVGNGGEYWGFDGYEQPYYAARRLFEAGDYRFLEVDLPNGLGGRVHDIPVSRQCDNHPLGSGNFSRSSSAEPLHGPDSTRLAIEFAFRFNEVMAQLLSDELNLECRKFTAEIV